MYKLIAIDLDDTLLADDLSIPVENINSLKAAKERGVYVVLCSGRESASMCRIMEKTNLFEDKDYFISYNGAFVQSVGGEVIWKDKIDAEDLKKFIAIGRKHKILTQCYCDSLVVEEENPRINKYESATGIIGKKIEDLMTLPYSIKLLFNSLDKEELEALHQDLIREFGEEYHYFYSKPEYLEVLFKTSNKGLAVERLANHLGLKAEEIICIGDSFNDSYMIEYAGLGVAMKNANPKVKEIADYVTEKNNNKAGVAEVVEKFILNDGNEENSTRA